MSILDSIKKPVKAGPDNPLNVVDDPFQEDFPGIFEVLACARHLGKDRETGRLIVYTEPGKAMLCLCDKDTEQVAFYACGTIQEALEGLERSLQSGSVDWRKDKRARYSR